MMNYKKHWDNVYSKSEINKLGWYEETPQPSLDLIRKCKLDKGAALLDVGSGATTLIENLIDEGYSNLTAVDISEVALKTAKRRLRTDEAAVVKWIVDDVTEPKHIRQIGGVDLWHDRTVLHFLTEESQRKAYLATLRKVVKTGGFVIIAVFSLEGARKCSGLDVKNYDHAMISEFLGSEFELLEHLPHVYRMPSGDSRPYIYTRFQKRR